MEIKKRFKLYKSGKNWCMAALMFAGASAGIFMNNVSANADDTTATSTDAKTETVTANDNDSQTKEVSLSATDASSTNADSASATTATSADKETTSTNKDDKNQLSSDWQAVDGGYVYQGSKDVKQNRHYELLPSIKGTGENWYLIDNGKAQSGVQEWAGSYWYFDPTTYLLSQKKDYVKSQWGMYYLVGNDGRIQSGVQEWAGSYWYFDPTTYLLSQKKNYVQSQWGDWYLVGNDGRIQSGVQEWAGSYWYFDPETYLLHKERGFITSQWGAKYLVGNDGRILSGIQEYDGKIYDIDPSSYQLTTGRNYKQAPNGNWYLFDNGIAQSGIQEWAGSYWYFDPQTYLLRQKRDYVQSQWGSWYLIDDSGRVQSGIQEWAGSYWYFDPVTYLLRQKRDYVQSQWGSWYLIDDSGRVQSGVQEWQGQYWYFDPSTYLLAPNRDIVEHGVKYHVNGSGVVENYVGLPELKQQLPQVIADKLNNNVVYNLSNAIAQIISQNGIDNKIDTIEKLMADNSIKGKVVKSQLIDLNKSTWDVNELAKTFINGIDSSKAKNAVIQVGVDEKSGQLDMLLFKPVANQLVSLDNKTYYFDGNSQLAKDKKVNINGLPYSFNSNGEMESGLVNVNGKVYYLDGTIGGPRKNYFYQDGKTTYYFNNQDGQGVNTLNKEWQAGQHINNPEFANGNRAYSYDGNSIQNINGFLTAESWYRPNQILKNGTTWTDSSATDYRPLLMTWWPSAKIQADYLNFMGEHGYLTTNDHYDENTNASILSEKASQVQRNLEIKLGQTDNSDWLKSLIHDFVKSESIWNESTENVDFGGLQLQGGFLKYGNSDLTPYANSAWRLIGRGPMNVDGNGPVQSEFLLANDIDNSNPVVQAEQLNWMHYLLNFGSITANDPDANFDGIRVDAVDNVDADLLQIAGDYFNAVYKANQSDANANKHLNILEDWTWEDAQYANSIGNPQLTMDQQLSAAQSMRSSLGVAADKRTDMKKMVTGSLVDRTVDDTENVAIPNYSFHRAHDNGSQDEIRQAIAATTGKPYGVFNQAEEEAGMEAYIADQNNTVKKWNFYNMPAIYAYMLTNKDTIPRVYYGDIFTDGGQYMEHKTRYYDAITNLLKSRVKYVAGGQTVNVDNHDVLTSVRFGKGAMKVTDAGTSETRTQGIGVVINNNPNLNLGNDEVVLHMGAAHKNQIYRAVLLTTNDGLLSFDSDKNAPIAKTDSNGDLHLFAKNLIVDGVEQPNTAIHGVANPDVSGYLAVWVPVGAADNQDARTQASTAKTDDGSMYHQNAALDSNVIFEAFSNFIYAPKQPSDAMNYKIARNATFFKNLGITSMELPPQYNSSKDGTFLDSTIDNGYAFTDRYDLGMSENNKYGSSQDLRDALKAIHAQGMQAMADWVPDQIYNLPGQEVVTATRSDEAGRTWEVSPLKNTLYVANTIGGGQYQKQYGGAFLDELKAKYPEIFTRKQRSTGTTIDPSTKITEWSAKYMNGTNILKRGVGYVLRYNGGAYYQLGDDDKLFLPNTLDPEGSKAIGFKAENGTVHFYEPSGMVKDQWKQDWIGNWYYFDRDGKMVDDGFKEVTVDGKVATYYFMPNGISFRSGLLTIAGHTHYFDGDGRMVKNQKVIDGAKTYDVDGNGDVVGESYNPAAEQPHPLTPNDLAK